MFGDVPAFSGFSVDDVDRVRGFYADVLGLEVADEHGMLDLRLATGATCSCTRRGTTTCRPPSRC
jgi:catechol 2,3-dioxygenase-like lactoylglutathione lyase family enzyme